MLPTTPRRGRRRARRSNRRRRAGQGSQWAASPTPPQYMPEPVQSTTEPAAAPQPRRESAAHELRFVLPVAIVSALFGAATAMVLCGLVIELRAVFGSLSSHYILAGGFLALALGIRVPQRVTMWACAQAWQRLVRRDKPSSVPDILITRGSADRPLYWIVLSIIALAAGIATACVPLGFRAVLAGYGWLQWHFVWSDLPLVALQISCGFLLGLAPLALLGLALSCAHHMSCPHGRWDVRATGWHLLGAGAGAWIVLFAASHGVATQALLIGASLPSLVVAVVCAGLISKKREQMQRQVPEPIDLPERSDRHPALLRAAIVVVGGGAAVAVTLAQRFVDAPAATTLIALAVAAGGAGVLLGVRLKPRGSRSMHGFGLCAVACGGAVVVASLALVKRPAVDTFATKALIFLMLGAFGFTTAYGREMLMARVASRSSEGSKMTARLLLCVALSVGIAAPLVSHAIGEPSTFVVLAVSLLALGAGLIGGDPTTALHPRRVRVSVVAASIVALAVVAVAPASPWRTASPSITVLATTDPSGDSSRVSDHAAASPPEPASLPINDH